MAIFTHYENYILGRDAKCLCCGNIECDGEKLVKGATVTRVITSKSKRFIHKKCMRKMWVTTDRTLTSYDASFVSQLDNHSVVIIAPIDEMPHFTECGMSDNPYSPTHRIFKLDNEVNGYRSGHIVKRTLEKSNYKVFINGEEVSTHSDYRKLLGK